MNCVLTYTLSFFIIKIGLFIESSKYLQDLIHLLKQIVLKYFQLYKYQSKS